MGLLFLVSTYFAVKMTKSGTSSSFPALCWCVICFRSLGTQGCETRLTSFSVQHYFPSTGFNCVALSSRCQQSTLFHPCIWMFSSFVSEEYTLGHVKTSTKYLLTSYLRLSHIFGSDTLLLHTWVHVSILFSFNHPCCCTTMPSCLLLHHHNATTESVWGDKRLQRDESPICIG